MATGINVYPTANSDARILSVFEPQPIYERQLVDYWFGMSKNKRLHTTAGLPLLIINHGIKNKNKGPDIKNAVIAVDGKIISGDVECHLRASDWHSHGHDRDPHYHQVILHLVQSLGRATIASVTHTIVMPDIDPFTCTLDQSNIRRDRIGVLTKFSAQRWAGFINNLYERSYLVILSRILGKNGNEENFYTLTNHLNLDHFATGTVRDHKQRIAAKAEELQIEWHHCAVRPAHWPEQRLGLLAELIHFHRGLDHMIPVDTDGLLTALQSGCPSGGRGILIEAAVNYFIPYCASQALQNNDARKYRVLKNQWYKLRLKTGYGSLRKKFSNFFSAKELCTVGIAQGLLGLEKHYCRPHYCLVCPLKKTSHVEQN